VRHNLVKLRLNWLASQQTSQGQGFLHAYQPLAETKQLIDTQELWSASTPEALQRALDKAQSTILKALDSPDFHTRLAAARLIFRSRQGRERGF
jgi:hypothetical protein